MAENYHGCSCWISSVMRPAKWTYFDLSACHLVILWFSIWMSIHGCMCFNNNWGSGWGVLYCLSHIMWPIQYLKPHRKGVKALTSIVYVRTAIRSGWAYWLINQRGHDIWLRIWVSLQIHLAQYWKASPQQGSSIVHSLLVGMIWMGLFASSSNSSYSWRHSWVYQSQAWI